MAKANRKRSTRHTSTSPEPKLGPSRVPDLSTIPDFSTLPDRYAMQTVGDCLAPIIADGAELVFSQTERPKSGDFVAVYLRPELARPGHISCAVKRLVLGLPGFCTFPFTPHPDDTVAPVVICESINPRRQFTIDADKLQAVHKCVGIQRKGKIEPIVNATTNLGTKVTLAIPMSRS